MFYNFKIVVLIFFVFPFFNAFSEVKIKAEDKFSECKELAKKGDAYAQFNIASCYALGLYTEKNSEKAFKWCLKAANQNHAKAQFNIGYSYEQGVGIEKNTEKAFD